MIYMSSNQIHLSFYELPSSLLEAFYFGPFCLYFLLLIPEFKGLFSVDRFVEILFSSCLYFESTCLFNPVLTISSASLFVFSV